MDSLIFPEDVGFACISYQEAVSLFSIPCDLDFMLDPFFKIRDSNTMSIVTSGKLVNNGDDFDLIVYPYGDKSPFRVRISESSYSHIKYTGASHPPAPPLPMRIFVPSDSEIRFFSTLCLDDYEWEGSIEVTLRWAFHYFKEPYPQGTLKVILPEKS